MAATWLAEVLRAAGLQVVELAGWKTRGNGNLSAVAACWHHDGSPVGASPNVPNYIRGEVDANRPGANIWVGLDGRWHLIAAGMTYHAGAVLPGKPGNATSIGIETDHTTGETWSGVVLLDSLRRGTAAILAHLGVGPAGGLEFHKTVCSPVGRKNDPDGLDLPVEQAAVAAHMTQEDDDMIQGYDKTAEDVARATIRELCDGHWGKGKMTAADQSWLLGIWSANGREAFVIALTDHAKNA